MKSSREETQKVEDAIASAIAPLIQAGVDADHQRTLAYGLVGLAEGTSRRWLRAGETFDPDRLSFQVADLAWAGLRGVRPA